jgi:hypothetical protein
MQLGTCDISDCRHSIALQSTLTCDETADNFCSQLCVCVRGGGGLQRRLWIKGKKNSVAWVRELQIQSSGFDSWRYKIFWEVVGLEQGPLSGSSLENQEYGCRDPSHWPRNTLYPQKLAPTSPTSGGLSVGIVRLRTEATEFSFSFLLLPEVEGMLEQVCSRNPLWRELTFHSHKHITFFSQIQSWYFLIKRDTSEILCITWLRDNFEKIGGDDCTDGAVSQIV